MRPTPRDWLLLAGLGFVWGASFMATKIATADFPPLTLAGGRLAVAAATLLAVLALRGGGLPGFASAEERGFWRHAVAVAFLSNALPFSLLAWGQRHIDSSLAGVLMATVPLFVLPLAHQFVPGERMTRRRIAGFALGFAGVVVLVGPAATAALSGPADGPAALAVGACLATALCYASGSIVAKRAPQLGLVRFAAAALMIATAMVVPLAFALESPLSLRPSAETAAAVVYLGLVPTALATVMVLTLIRSAGPGFYTTVNYQIPLWSVVLGALALGESPEPRLGLALVLILAGVAVAQNLVGLRRGGHARG
jgi:drug/metabolite transporter (DMT)-like permease